MNEGVVFELLDSLQFSKVTEGLLQDLLRHAVSQVPDEQDLDLQHRADKLSFAAFLRAPSPSAVGAHLGHDLRVGVLDGVGPLHRHQAVPHLHLPAHQPAAGLSGCFVVFVLQEAETSVLLLVVRLEVEDDVTQSFCSDTQRVKP